MYKFLEVFPTIKVSNNFKDLFENVEVVKVGRTSDESLVKIYIKSDRLIQKETIYKLEKLLQKQVFNSKTVTVKIIDRYCLSKQYTPQALLDVYLESMLLELQLYWTLEYNMVKAATISADGDKIKIELQESIFSHKYEESIREYFKHVFLNRFSMDIDVDIEYKNEKKKSFKEENEHELQLIVHEICKNKAIYDKEKGENTVDASKTNNDNQDDTKGVESKNENTSEKHTEFAPAKDANKGGKGGNFDKNNNYGNYSKPKPNNPDVLYGKDFDEEPIAIEKIQTEMGEVVISGMVRNVEIKEIRNEKSIIMFDVTDFTDTITVKMFTRNEQRDDLLTFIDKKKFLKIKGITMIDKFDRELTIGSVSGIRKSVDTRVKRMDLSLHKRVELHCHTKMSDMDGVTKAGTIIKQAISWGQKAIAITDHGNVQGFTDAFHTIRDIQGDYKKKGEKLDFKVIYGVEAYLVDDIKEMVINSKNQSLDEEYIVFDIETTGFSAQDDKIIEIGAVKIVNGEITDRFSSFINPEIPIPFRIEKLTGISDSMVMDAPLVDVVLKQFLNFCGDGILVAHNAEFDKSFIKNKAAKLGLGEINNTIVDTLPLGRFLIPNLHNFKLDTICKHLNVSLENHHRAVDDAAATADMFMKMINMLKERDIDTLDKLNASSQLSDEAISKLPSHHAIILATSEQGRINLYRLISASHLIYYNRRPKIPKSMYLQHKEGLLIGSACEAGELYQAILNGAPQTEIARLVNFYDYLEIQPLGNNKFMIDKPEIHVESNEDLIAINKKIIELGEKFNKMVVATCDVHFLNPEDEIYRRIIMAGKGFDDADNQAPLYLRTTEEMLAEFNYLDPDKAEEIVITNTNKIMQMCETIDPVRPDKCPPVIENSDQTLRTICYNRAHEIYGPELPEIVTERLERELNSIISNGYSVMYIIAQKLVWKSNDDGYLVGSRGSVGSSFVATMAGITEVNPLSPHYICPECYYSDFYSEDVKKFSGGAGCDMPDKICPQCGHKLNKEGFDIPFETFLGFKGNKEPDIDLNFSGEYQSKAHAYTEVIFGKGQTFKAGTIGTLADKTAFGYVKHYFEDKSEREGINYNKRVCEINRIVEGCVDVKRTTGQHPGGIIVLPHGQEIHTFTPIQHPANDMTTNIVTTHFDYHSIDHNLLKLDILGHDDPTMIRMLQDLTGMDPRDIPLDSKEVMSLFKDTSALKIQPEDIGGCKLGALGIPEFGTDFAMQMLIDTQPKYFSDLVRIAGLSHGTDVWLGNAQTLLKEGKATISTAICTRDDIMIYLISKGMDSEQSFTIMEAVRKGKGLKPEWEELMIQHDVPDWYIWSCKKIKYMFPKAHAAAYVMMAWRIAYCKVFYPLAFYSAFFSIRASNFSYALMCMGRPKLDSYIADYKARNETKSLSPKEEGQLKDMRIVQEMYARGFDFEPIDLFKVKARHFQIVGDKIMPSLVSIDGLGENAAEAIEIAARDGEFLSKDDLKQRAKIGQSIVELLDSLGILGKLPDTNQLSLFDL